MGQMDQGFKAWYDLCKAEVTPFLVGDLHARYLGDFPAEVATERQLIPDSLSRMRSGKGTLFALDVEAQSYPDSKMPRRMFEYAARVMLAYELMVRSVVIWLFKQRGRRVPRSPYQMYIDDDQIGIWKFTSIELYALPASAIIKAEQTGLLALIPFTLGATAETVEIAMRRVREEVPIKQAEQLAALLGVFSTRFYGEQFALDLVRRYFMSTEILQEFPLFRTMMAEAEAKGKAEGEARGEALGMRATILRVLEGRSLALSQEMIAAINAADLPALNDLALHAGTDTLEQLLARLDLPAREQ